MFYDLPPESSKTLAGIKQIERFGKKVKIFSAGDEPRRVHILVKGQAHLSFNAEPRIVRPVEPNEILGVIETFNCLPFEIQLETISPCVFEFIESENFLRFLRDEPQVCFRLVKLLGSNLQKSCRFICSSIN